MAELKIGLIGGSGLAQALAGQVEGVRHEVDTPFGRPSDAILEVPFEGQTVFLLSRHGPGHVLNPTAVPYRANVFALKALGVTHVIASGAVGSLRDEFRPRDLVVADQVIDKTNKRAGTFYEGTAVHTEFADPFCPVLRQLLIEQGQDLVADAAVADPPPAPDVQPSAPAPAPFAVHSRGCYVCMEGPAFSSRAESHMHRLWGGDLIGMTAMPEAKLAREAEIAYALVALVTDYDCWKTTPGAKGPGQPAATAAEPADPAALLREIIANLQAASDNAIRLIRSAVRRTAADPELRDRLLASPTRSALRLAIWSDKARVPPAEVDRLRPLWGRYFEG
ncbi:MAG: Purine nucleoside phosphorylase [Phycisphaerales bacterium]|nr:Purine nucleoside phosphorylase [Phycisphaerales bacterium]